MFTRTITITIKRAFCHHRDLIQTPVSILSDKEKIEYLTNKINIINTKIDSIHSIDNIYKFCINCIFIPFLLFKG
jgi:hypothetical protein